MVDHNDLYNELEEELKKKLKQSDELLDKGLTAEVSPVGPNQQMGDLLSTIIQNVAPGTGELSLSQENAQLIESVFKLNNFSFPSAEKDIFEKLGLDPAKVKEMLGLDQEVDLSTLLTLESAIKIIEKTRALQHQANSAESKTVNTIDDGEYLLLSSRDLKEK